MNTFIQTNIRTLLLVVALFALTGCSTIDAYRAPVQAPAVIPKIPEIKRHQAARQAPRQVQRPRYTPPKKVVVPKRRSTVTSSSYQIRNKLPVAKVIQPELSRQQKLEAQKLLQKQAQKNATVDVDPFASIPESASQKTLITPTVPANNPSPKSVSSPAVKSLMTSARADIALGRSRSAVSKLERGLRIEPQNAQLWHMLARAHYSNSAYLHAISIAKKSNANTNDEDLIAQNWKLIKQAGERSGNASAIKEALDYIKLNP